MSLGKIAILGAGQLGCADANYFGERTSLLTLYDRNPGIVSHINEARQHPVHFPDVNLPYTVRATSSLEALALSQPGLIIVDLHSSGIRPVFRQLAPYLYDGVVIVNHAKGLEPETHKLPLEVVAEEMQKAGKRATLAAVSGWMIARNLVNGGTSYVEVACADDDIAAKLQQLMQSDTLKVKTSRDVIGVQMAGILKNYLSIVAGFFDGMEKANPERRNIYMTYKKHYMEEATEEARRIAVSCGADGQTFGISNRSYAWWRDYSGSCDPRNGTINRLLGEFIGRGMTPLAAYRHIRETTGRTPEGYHTVNELYALVSERGLLNEVPILHNTYRASTGTGIEEALMDGVTGLASHGRLSRVLSAAGKVRKKVRRAASVARSIGFMYALIRRRTRDTPSVSAPSQPP